MVESMQEIDKHKIEVTVYMYEIAQSSNCCQKSSSKKLSLAAVERPIYNVIKYFLCHSI